MARGAGRPLDVGDGPGHTRRLRLPLAGIVAVGCVLLAIAKLYWMLVGWVASGMLFAYNLFVSQRADAQASPEHPLARVVATQVGIVLGLVMALVVLLVLHDRRRAPGGASTATE